ncbi:MAG: hypothetical protein CR993_00415 [Rhodobacterales bacterium]|nr:MAG: hypothetical protein CR993_00415 [Rhodobacterales bacterium]
MAFKRSKTLLAASSALALLAACSTDGRYVHAGDDLFNPPLGGAVANNIAYHTGEKRWVVDLAKRFAREVPNTITFAFNSATLDAEARAVLTQQAAFIRKFPEVRFRVYGHTDLVGSAAYNKRLGMRRARAAVAFLSRHGISRSRLEAVVSYGETQPLIQTPNRERQNRRTVTEVSGFLQDHPLILNGRYAEIIFRDYVTEASEDSDETGSETLGD